MVEIGKVKRKGIVREAKQGRTMHLISTLRHNSDSQGVSQEKSYGTIGGRAQKWVDSSIRMIFPSYTRSDMEKSKKIFMSEVSEEQ